MYSIGKLNVVNPTFERAIVTQVFLHALRDNHVCQQQIEHLSINREAMFDYLIPDFN